MWIFVFAFLSTAFGASMPAPKCVVSELIRVNDLPPYRSQDGIGFCYAHITTAHLQHQYCKHKPGGCKYGVVRDRSGRVIRREDDRLSVLDVALQSYPDHLKNGYSRNDSLLALRNSGEAAREACLPFDVLANAQVLPAMNRPERVGNPVEKMRDYYEKNYKRRKTQAGNCVQCRAEADSLARQLNKGITTPEILAALTEPTFEEFLGSIAKSFGCENKREKIPPFKIVSSKENNPARFRNFILEGLRKNRLVDTGVCIHEEAPKDCRPHATMISGSRKVCCGTRCSYQYKLYDSFGGVWANKWRDGNWVNATEMERRMGIWSNLPSVKKFKLSTMSYIEDK